MMPRLNRRTVAWSNPADLPGHSVSAQPGKLRVVYVAGSGHTGSTLLAMLLDAHPRIVSVGEISVKPKIRRRGNYDNQRCSCGSLIGECPFWVEIFDAVNRQGYEFGATCWSNDYRVEHPFVNKLLTQHSSHRPIRALQRWAARHLPVHRARMARIDRVNVAFIQAALQIARADVFVDASKGTARLYQLMGIPELDIRVVRLLRDARGYAASAKRRGRSIYDAAETWRKDQEVIAEVISSLPSERQFTLKYESLCSDLPGTLQRLHGFCGVEPMVTPPSIVSQEHHVLGNNMRVKGSIDIRLDETWRSRLTDEEQRSVMKIVGPLNAAFGYL
jgi:hypothetical protein